MTRKCLRIFIKNVRFLSFLCSHYTGTKQQVSLLRRKDPEGSHTNFKDIGRLEQICCGWMLPVTFCLTKAIILVCSIRTVQNSIMCTAVVNWRVKHWLVLHVENC